MKSLADGLVSIKPIANVNGLRSGPSLTGYGEHAPFFLPLIAPCVTSWTSSGKSIIKGEYASYLTRIKGQYPWLCGCGVLAVDREKQRDSERDFREREYSGTKLGL